MKLFLQKEWAPWLLGILLLTLVAYAAALNNLFIPFDDNTLIYLNPAVAHVSARNLWFIFTSYDPELYIPFTFLSYAAIHAVAGLNPAAYHAASLLLHCVNVLVVAWIVLSLTQKRSVALITALLFALHPLHSEVVLWAAAMKDVLSSTFGLLAIAFYLEYRTTHRQSFWTFCIVAFACGLLSKVGIVLVPLLLLLIDWMDGRKISRENITAKWPLFLLSGIFLIIALAGKGEAIQGIGFFTTVLLSVKSTAFYILKLLVPSGLSLLYPQVREVSVADPFILGSILLVLSLLVLAFCIRNRSRRIAGGILWYFLLLLPSFSTFNKNNHIYFASARYAYLPSIGLFLIVALFVYFLWQRVRMSRIPLAIAGACITVAYVVLSHEQVGIWHDSKALFGNVLRLYPEAVIAYNNYATELTDPKEALPYFQKAIALEPTFILAYRNMAGLYRKTGDEAAERGVYEQSMPILLAKERPTQDDISLLFEYAEFLDEHGERSAMFQWLNQAITLDPAFAEGYYNLGVKYEKYGQITQAVPLLEKALELGGDKPDTLYHLASVYAQTGKLKEAADLLERLVDINPTYEKAASHLENIKKMLGE